MVYAEYCFEVFLEGTEWRTGMTPFTFYSQHATSGYTFDVLRGNVHDRIDFVEHIYPIERNGMLRLLPKDRQGLTYCDLDVTGDYIKHLDLLSDAARREDARLRPTPLAIALEHVCRRSRTWALFAKVDCEEVHFTATIRLDELASYIDRFLADEMPDLEDGFALISRSD